MRYDMNSNTGVGGGGGGRGGGGCLRSLSGPDSVDKRSTRLAAARYGHEARAFTRSVYCRAGWHNKRLVMSDARPTRIGVRSGSNARTGRFPSCRGWTVGTPDEIHSRAPGASAAPSLSLGLAPAQHLHKGPISASDCEENRKVTGRPRRRNATNAHPRPGDWVDGSSARNPRPPPQLPSPCSPPESAHRVTRPTRPPRPFGMRSPWLGFYSWKTYRPRPATPPSPTACRGWNAIVVGAIPRGFCPHVLRERPSTSRVEAPNHPGSVIGRVNAEESAAAPKLLRRISSRVASRAPKRPNRIFDAQKTQEPLYVPTMGSLKNHRPDCEGDEKSTKHSAGENDQAREFRLPVADDQSVLALVPRSMPNPRPFARADRSSPSTRLHIRRRKFECGGSESIPLMLCVGPSQCSGQRDST